MGWVDCVGGEVHGGGGPYWTDDAYLNQELTCDEVCNSLAASGGGTCCVGVDSDAACENFTGRVCRDDSCVGRSACRNSRIALVKDSCKVGEYACDGIDIQPADAKSIIGSCKGHSACAGLAGRELNDDADTTLFTAMGDIENSCNGDNACERLAFGGWVDNVRDSCNGPNACQFLVEQGKGEDVTGSCNGESACMGAGRRHASARQNRDDGDLHPGYVLYENYGSVGSLINSCDASFACNWLAAYTGQVSGRLRAACRVRLCRRPHQLLSETSHLAFVNSPLCLQLARGLHWQGREGGVLLQRRHGVPKCGVSHRRR